MPKITHALSIREPYAWLIAAGFKLAEIRSVQFPKKFTEPTWIAIHASMSREECNDEDLNDYLNELDPELTGILWDDKWHDKDKRLFGHSEIIGAMRVNHSFVPTENADDPCWERWADVMHSRSERCTTNLHPNEFMDFEGMHNWIIDDVYRFHNPIVSIGRLGVWPLGDILSKLVDAQFSKALGTGGIDRCDPIGKPIIYQMPKGATKRFYDVYPRGDAQLVS